MYSNGYVGKREKDNPLDHLVTLNHKNMNILSSFYLSKTKLDQQCIVLYG